MFDTKAMMKAAGVILALALAGPVQAGEPQASSDVRQTWVGFKDLDLSTPAGGEALLRRVRKAATQVCRSNDRGTLHGGAEYRRCRSEAIQQAVSEVDRPMLTAALRGRSSISLAQGPGAKAGD